MQGTTKWLSFSPDGKTLASCGDGPIVRLWDVADGKEAIPQSGHESAVRSIATSPTDGTVFTGDEAGAVRRWDPLSTRESEVFTRVDASVTALAVSPDGMTVVAGGEPQSEGPKAGTIEIWNVAERRQLGRIAPFADHEVVTPVFAPDGKTLASQGSLWDATSGTLVMTLAHRDPANGHFLNFSPMFYAPAGGHVITAEPYGVWIWDPATGRELGQAVRWLNDHDRAALSPDGRFLATHGPPGGHSHGRRDDLPVILWELASGREAARIEAQGEALLRRPFSPDGRFLASASRNRGMLPHSTVRILDLATGCEVRRFDGHHGSVTAIAFTPDGRSLVSGGEDGLVFAWDISDLTASHEPAKELTPEVLERRWRELADADAEVAYRAAWALSVPSAIEFLGDHLRPADSSDQNEVPTLIGPVKSPQLIRVLRALAALERVATTEARAVLDRMARGNPGAMATRHARLALERLRRRVAAAPASARP
jgi:WD40 repeat protein